MLLGLQSSARTSEEMLESSFTKQTSSLSLCYVVNHNIYTHKKDQVPDNIAAVHFFSIYLQSEGTYCTYFSPGKNKKLFSYELLCGFLYNTVNQTQNYLSNKAEQ